MQVHVLHTFACVSAASAASLAATNPSMKESTKGGGRRRQPPPFVEAARSAASFMDGFVEAKESALALSTLGLTFGVLKPCSVNPCSLSPEDEFDEIWSEPKVLP